MKQPRKLVFTEAHEKRYGIEHDLTLIGNNAINERDAWAQTIMKWRLLSIQEYPTRDGGQITCGLCNIYRLASTWNICRDDNEVECPMARFAGSSHCLGTPYQSYGDALYERGTARVLRGLAREELNFVLKAYRRWLITHNRGRCKTHNEVLTEAD